MYPPNKNSVPDHNKNTIGLQKYKYLPSHISPFASGFKSLKNKANDDRTETTDTSRNNKYDTSRTSQYDSIKM